MVTIYAWRDEYLVGWKELPDGYTDLGGICNSTDNYENMMECINNK